MDFICFINLSEIFHGPTEFYLWVTTV